MPHQAENKSANWISTHAQTYTFTYTPGEGTAIVAKIRKLSSHLGEYVSQALGKYQNAVQTKRTHRANITITLGGHFAQNSAMANLLRIRCVRSTTGETSPTVSYENAPEQTTCALCTRIGHPPWHMHFVL